MYIFYIFMFLTCVATSKCDRLPSGVQLYGYNLHLNFTEESFTRPPYEYHGYLQLRFSMYQSYGGDLKMYADHNFIKVESAYLEINSTATEITSFKIDNSTDILTLGGTSKASLTAYDSYVNIFYTSRISVTDMYGLYKLSYPSYGETKYMVATQFEPTFARRVFPCLDELTYKTSLRLNITHPTNMEAYFNTDIDDSIDPSETTDDLSATTYFKTSGDMETYMAAFAIIPSLDFTCTIGENITSSMYYWQVCSRFETEATRNWALEVGPLLMRDLNNFTNFPYGLMMGFPKMDLFALPDMVVSAAENFGLVNIREQNLLFDEENSSNLDKQNIAQMITFEFAQMWFGNLASPAWWNYNFFTKGLDYYLQYFITDRVIEDWFLDKQFVFRVFYPALELDSLMNTPSLRDAVNSTEEIITKLDKLTYLKGASFFRMLKEVITGYDYFQKGLEYFLTSFRKRNTEPQGMWNLISAQININNRDLLPEKKVLKEVLIDWELNPGFPLLEVSREGPTKLKVEQKGRFLYTDLDIRYEWYIPVNYAFSSEVSDFENTTLNQWLLPNSSIEIELLDEDEEWVILNTQAAGYYRTNYGDMWQNITSALKQPDFSGIPELNRAQLLNDILALARASVVNYTVAFDLVKYLSEENSLYPWMAALNGANYILRRVGYSTTLGLKIEALFLNLISNVYSTVPWASLDADDHIYSIKQIEILTGACKLGYIDCVRNAVNKFQTLKNTGTRPDKNLRSVVYCTGMLYNSDPSDWNTLWKAFQTTDLATEKVKILSALGCTENEALLEQSLQLTLNQTSGINNEDISIIFTSVYSNSKAGANVALKFLIANHQAIVRRYQDMNCIRNMVLGLAEHLTETAQISQLRNFLLNTADLEEEFKGISDQALEITDINVIWLDRHLEELNQYFQIGSKNKA